MRNILLFILLAFPPSVYVFLRFFGENVYALPVLHKNSDRQYENCPSVTFPFRIPADTLKNWNIADHHTIIYSKNNSDGHAWNRVLERFDKASIKILLAKIPKSQTPDRRITVFSYSFDPCLFLSENPNASFLIDKKGQIRGEYDLQLPKEEDRLIVELELLLKEYGE